MRKIITLYSVGLADLLNWTEVRKLAISSVLPVPILVIGAYASAYQLVSILISVMAYGAVYLYLVKRTGIKDVNAMMTRFRRKLGIPG